nr:transmembrane protein, putative [Tanacetum cinerariifolium]
MCSKIRSSSSATVVVALNLLFVVVYSSTSDLSSSSGPHQLRRGLKVSFKESNSNVTFDCSPSGPCLPCQYHEKKDETFRCSETGYQHQHQSQRTPSRRRFISIHRTSWIRTLHNLQKLHYSR